MQLLAIEPDTVTWRGDQPALSTEPLGKMHARTGENVMGRLVPGYIIELLIHWQGMKTQKRMQMMRLTACRLDTPVHFTAIRISGQHRLTLTPDYSPENPVQQIPAPWRTITRSAF